MNLLFLDGASSCHNDSEGNLYVGTNVNGAIIQRYRRYCDNLTILLMQDEKLYTPSEAQSKFDPADLSIVNIVAGPNCYKPRINFLNPMLKLKIIKIVEREVMKADKVIIRAPGRFYTDTALRMCRKYHKLYLIESVEFAYEFRRYGKLYAKPFAPYAEYICRREIARAPYVVYVSQRALQERYPTNGKSLGCSDVELPELDPLILERRTKREAGDRIIFGTAGNIGSYKGQEYVLQAVAELKRQGITNIEYHLAGAGAIRNFEDCIRSLGIHEQVKLYGPVPHEKIFDWYDHLDVYIQPSLTESLGRSVVEAMSRGLPAACSRVGGMVEYASGNIMFEAKNVKQICEVMKKLLDPEIRKKESAYSLAKAKEFEKSRLDPIRDKFYMDFMRS